MSLPNPAERIAAFVKRHSAAQQNFLAELVRQPSDNPPGDCAPHGARTLALLEGLGLRAEAFPVPEEACLEAGMVSATNLIVRERFGPGPTVALNAHGDVVPPGANWTADPYGAEIREGWMYGRGAAVSKSDIATYAYAVLALRDANLLRGTVELHITYDEEAGGEIGPKWLLAERLSKPDFAICAGFSYQVAIAHNGCLHLELVFSGRSAHAAEPENGSDALEAATCVLGALYAQRKSYRSIQSGVGGIGSPTLVAGLISGGVNTNVVPDRVTVRLDRRIIPEEDPLAVERELTGFIEDRASLLPGVTCTVRRILLAEPLRPGPGTERLANLLRQEAEQVLGEPVPVVGVPLYTDARHYAAAGIPTVLYGAGPRTLAEANAHRADERLFLQDLRNATEVAACSLMRLLGKEEGAR